MGLKIAFETDLDTKALPILTSDISGGKTDYQRNADLVQITWVAKHRGRILSGPSAVHRALLAWLTHPCFCFEVVGTDFCNI